MRRLDARNAIQLDREMQTYLIRDWFIEHEMWILIKTTTVELSCRLVRRCLIKMTTSIETDCKLKNDLNIVRMVYAYAHIYMYVYSYSNLDYSETDSYEMNLHGISNTLLLLFFCFKLQTTVKTSRTDGPSSSPSPQTGLIAGARFGVRFIW